MRAHAVQHRRCRMPRRGGRACCARRAAALRRCWSRRLPDRPRRRGSPPIPNDKLLPACREHAPQRCYDDGLRAGPALRRLPALDRHRAPACAGSSPASAIAALIGARARRSRSASFRSSGATLAPFVAVSAMIPPLGHAADPVHRLRPRRDSRRSMLIVIGIAPVMVRDIAQRVARAPARAAGQGADPGRLDLADRDRVVLPQILPRLITCVRLALGPAWLFLISAEAIAADRAASATASSWCAATWRWT